MIDFKAPGLSDKGWIMELSQKSNLRSSDYSYGIIYGWRDTIDPKVARLEDRLLYRIHVKSGYLWSYPVGSGEIRPAIELMRKDAESLGVPFRLRGIPEEALPQIEAVFEDRPEVSLNTDSSDYVYLTEKLATLSGRKLHSKKNHVNRFMAENNWSFETIGRDNINECHDLAARWFIASEEERGTNYTSEVRALRRILEEYFDLGFYGGLIRRDGGACAFTIGERISQDTLVTHFEKCDPKINGGYAIINQQFAAYILNKLPGVKFINREEDMGIENLRKAKQSYRPEFMAHKYMAVWK